jgi:hypothetical protein
MLYCDKIESLYSDSLLQRKPKHKRDLLLQNVPNDQLICLLNFMDVEECRTLFSSTVIKNCFQNIPIEDTFPLVRDCKSFYLEFIPKCDIQIRIEFMSLRMFTQEMIYHYKTLTRLLTDHVITKQMIVNKLHSATLSELARICRENPVWYKWIHPHPLLEKLPFPTDVSKFIFTFL